MPARPARRRRQRRRRARARAGRRPPRAAAAPRRGDARARRSSSRETAATDRDRRSTVHAARSEDLARVGGPLRDACACALRTGAGGAAGRRRALPAARRARRPRDPVARAVGDPASDVSTRRGARSPGGCARRQRRASLVLDKLARHAVAVSAAARAWPHAARCADGLSAAGAAGRSLRSWSAPHLRARKSEGRGRQDDHRDQRRRVPGGGRARACCSSTSIRRPTRRAGSASDRARPRARRTTCCTAPRSPT